MLVVANKADLQGYAGIMEMSTATGTGIKEVQDQLVSMLTAQEQPVKSTL